MANNYIYALRQILSNGQETEGDEAVAATHHGQSLYVSVDGKLSAVKRSICDFETFSGLQNRGIDLSYPKSQI